jgi:excisionase family DNA binding protein
LADYLKIPEVARRLDVSEPTVRRMVKGGKLPSVFIGGAYRISEEDIAEYIESARVTLGKAQAPPSQRSLFNGLEEERRAVWEAAVDEARRLRETGWAQMWKALSEWRASKQRGEPYTTRRKYLDEMGNLLREVYDADDELGRAYVQAALTTKGGSEASVPSYLQEEARKTGHFYGELRGLAKSAGLSVLTGADATAAKQATAEHAAAEHAAAEHVQSEMRPLRVEEPRVA